MPLFNHTPLLRPLINIIGVGILQFALWAPSHLNAAPKKDIKKEAATVVQSQRLLESLFEAQVRYADMRIFKQKFTHSDYKPLLEQYAKHPALRHQIIGTSVLGRSIHRLQFGRGPLHVVMWSQMHGNESTASAAILDLLSFLTRDDELNPLRKNLEDKLTITIIPMLNPDGAQTFIRQNAQAIDINRDALRLQSPEGRLLTQQIEELKPHFAFNLHDQIHHIGAGRTQNPATLSFLAPAYNAKNDINASRQQAMLVIAWLNRALQTLMPNQIARYDDEFEARAFGDNIQKLGVSTVLIEAGSTYNDPEKLQVRRLHFATLIGALQCLAQQSHSKIKLSDYFAIPTNKYNQIYKLIVRQATVRGALPDYVADIGIHETIEHVGDLTTFGAYTEIDAKDMILVPNRALGVKQAASFRLYKDDVLVYEIDGNQARKITPPTPVPQATTTEAPPTNTTEIIENKGTVKLPAESL